MKQLMKNATVEKNSVVQGGVIMREYLFKAKRVDNGEWVEGDFVSPSNVVWTERGFDEVLQREELIAYDEAVIPETVGQFTGLCDKNGKRIFEGDIISSDSNSKFIIKWNNNKAKFVCAFVNKSEDYFGDYYCNLSDKYIKQNFNVIGNIHDNKELLEVEE